MLSFMALGLVVGMAHALEADHLAAVGALAAGENPSRRRLAWLGVSWGLGHTTALLVISLSMVLLGLVLTARIEAGLEFAIGIMLVVLGVSVIVKLRREKVHLHLHNHSGGSQHFHAHSHKTARVPHHKDQHEHRHAPLLSRRSYLVGLAHGAAGSAGLIAVAAAATQSLTVTLTYILLFGIGSTFGMGLLTMAASWPLKYAEASATRLFRSARITLACATVLVGLGVMAGTGPAALGIG